MAISQVHPMFPLILSLFFLPTLLAVHLYGGISVTASEEFVEEWRKGFNLTCSTGTVLTKGFILAVVERDIFMGPILNIQPYNLCDLITCPVSPGSFVITFRKLYPVRQTICYILLGNSQIFL
ncbi:hypothetical protein DY000_02012609 [Brassica cretica]|uniref:MD-2-related lipid-recognition domain-containing protein n=1 Tax=Brassica cretica TaxID=69181 RepID=A0ABQ7CXY7_BRACR|nr:hypothetical protein DY000_02012609 [Brassica cretica]